MRAAILALFLGLMVAVFAAAPDALFFQEGDKTYAGFLHDPSVNSTILALNTSIAGMQVGGNSICRLRNSSLTCFVEAVIGSTQVGSMALVKKDPANANDAGTVLGVFALSSNSLDQFPISQEFNLSDTDMEALSLGHIYVNAYQNSVGQNQQNVSISDLGSVSLLSLLGRCDFAGTAAVEGNSSSGQTQLFGASFFGRFSPDDNLIAYYFINTVNSEAGCQPGGWHAAINIPGITDQGSAQTGEDANTWGLSANMDCLPQIMYGVAPGPDALDSTINGNHNVGGAVVLSVFSIPSSDTSRPQNKLSMVLWHV